MISRWLDTKFAKIKCQNDTFYRKVKTKKPLENKYLYVPDTVELNKLNFFEELYAFLAKKVGERPEKSHSFPPSFNFDRDSFDFCRRTFSTEVW
mgnify:CR=1 FL=1